MLKLNSPFKVAAISVISGILFSLTFWQVDIYNRKQAVRKDFEQEITLRYSLIKDELLQLEYDLEQIEKLFSNLDSINSKEFNLSTNGYLTSRPELIALDWAPLVEATARENFEKNTGKIISELNESGNFIRRTMAENYYPVLYTASKAKLLDITGFDHTSINIRENAIKNALKNKSTQAILTDRMIRLTNNSDKETFFIFFRPVAYKNQYNNTSAIKGFIIGFYSTKNLLNRIREKISTSEIDFEFVSESSKNDASQNPTIFEPYDFKDSLYQLKEIRIGDNILNLRFISGQNFINQRMNTGSFDFLIIPLILTTVVSSLFYLISKKNHQLQNAQSLANQKSAELKAAYDAKTEFLADISHEIRSPLTSIIGYSEILLNKDLAAQEKESFLSAVYKTSRYLLSLVNHILDISKFEAGYNEPYISCQSIKSLTENVSVLIERKALDKNLNFEIDYKYPLPEFFSTDHTKLKQILVNLLDNAIKFTCSGGIKLIISYDKFKKELRFSVSDTGIGISEDQKKKLFSSFSQAEIFTSQIYGGTGLGLFISKKLSQILGGNLELQSTSGQGSLFTLSLPFPEISESDLIFKHKSEIKSLQHKQPNISELSEFNGNLLLVEDSIENQKYLSMLFTKMGFNLTVVSDGSDAINAAGIHKYDLIIMDIQMQEIGGLEACKILREKGIKTPILALSADTRHEIVEQIFNAGFNNYISKPFSNEAIKEKLRTLVDFKDPLNIQTEDRNKEYEKDKADFIDGFAAQIKLIEEALESENYTLLKITTHKLAGAAAFAYSSVYEPLMQINHAAADSDENRLRSALTILKDIHLETIANHKL